MNKVRLLPPDVIRKIAAGEVIERPASAVKELVENALDAGTRSLEIHLRQSGKSLIQVKDTGSGIEQDDIEKLFQRHSTSKITTADDLDAIQTLGFRGEALFSIGAIADVCLRSKTAGGSHGWEIHVRGGERLSLKPVTMNAGTDIEIKELFFNTPARKKFLKSDTTELKKILDICLPYALLYPGVRVLITHQGRELLHLAPRDNPVARMAEALRLPEKHLIEVHRDFTKENIRCSLLLGDINLRRPNKDLQFLYVNNRPVANRSLSFHLNQAFRLIMPEKTHPVFAVNLCVPTDHVDVNVHPTKREVKLKNEPGLAALLRSLVEHALMSSGQPKQIREPVSIDNRPNVAETPVVMESRSPVKNNLTEEANTYSHAEFAFAMAAINSNQTPSPIASLKEKLQQARWIGTFQKKYLLFETSSSLLFMDQHAAHERINYETLKKQVENHNILSQRLLQPVVIELNAQEHLMWQEAKKNLDEIGFVTDAWSPSAIAVHAYPQVIQDPEQAVRAILSDEKTDSASWERLAQKACRFSVMTGDVLKPQEAESLKTKLLCCQAPFTCPHGRPTVIEVDQQFLNRQFLRS